MDTAKVAIRMDRRTLHRLDLFVRNQMFPSRSRAIQDVIEEKLTRLEHTRLSEECAKLDPVAEKAMAEEGLSRELNQWPEY